MTPELYLVRHAETALNNPDEERIRGYSDVPIDHNGKEKMEEVGKFLQHRGIVHILASPLQRAMMSATIIGEATGADVKPSKGLLPWHLGVFTEQPVAEVAKKMDYYQEYPDMIVPQGESYRDFYNRWTDGLERMLRYAEEHYRERIVGVVHSRNVLALPSILGSKNIGDVPVKGGPKPASVTRVYKDNGTWRFEVVYGN